MHEVFYDKLIKGESIDGLWPIYVSPDTGAITTSTVTLGALGDSFYEYLLKTWLQGGRKEPRLRKLYDAAMDGVEKLLLKVNPHFHLANN